MATPLTTIQSWTRPQLESAFTQREWQLGEALAEVERMRPLMPFQRERDIRAGKLDKEVPGYEEISGWLGRVPMTWLPDLLISVVKQCMARKVFRDNASLIRTAENATRQNAVRPKALIGNNAVTPFWKEYKDKP